MRARAPVVAFTALLVASAMGLVTAQHRARSAFVDLEREQQRARELGAEGDRLRIELGRLAHPAAIEAAARNRGLRPLEPARTVLLPAPAPAVPTVKEIRP